MKRDINTTGAAARALNARNPVTFTCMYPLEESIRRLAAITGPKGFVDETTVRLERDRVRFEGSWSSRLDVATLEGVMVPHGVARTVVPAFAVVTFTAAAAATNGGGYWAAGIMIGIFLVAMPLFVAYLGSARVAAEIELERIIGSTIGDPEKYASRWRRWQDE